MKKFFKILMTFFSITSFVIGLIIFICVLNASGGKIPSVFGMSFMQVQTGSMTPAVNVGDVIVVKKVDTDSLAVGDIISFYSTDQQITGRVNTHRIVRIEKNMSGYRQFITKGDANSVEDSIPVSSINVIGKMTYDLGLVGSSVLGILRNPKIIFIFIILPLIFITFSEAYHLVAMIAEVKVEKQREKNNEESEEKKD